MNISRHIQHTEPVTVKLKLRYHLKAYLKPGGGGATRSSQDFMTTNAIKRAVLF